MFVRSNLDGFAVLLFAAIGKPCFSGVAMLIDCENDFAVRERFFQFLFQVFLPVAEWMCRNRFSWHVSDDWTFPMFLMHSG